ncbi:helix-turn-helix domain-containing protein [Streptomyces sp. NPDC048297]|uniref:helix-turn-helix domain-containing protein n=1 Tax=Streptomyces sp. NPDC048297 TaxID=3365531 RepID=UPI003721DD9B
MLEQSPVFGAELRRLRIAAGLTLTQLASVVHYSKGQLSKIETGRKRPTVELARLCDVALDARGALTRLVPAPSPTPRPRGTTPTPHGTAPTPDDPAPTALLPVLPAGIDATGEATGETPEAPGAPMDPSHPGAPSRRQVIAAGAASVLAAKVAELRPGGAGADALAGETLVGSSRVLLDQYRRIAQLSPPEVLVPVLAEQTRALRSMAVRSGARTGRDLLALAARFAEFTGWLAQESGDETGALRWTRHAVDLADASGDHDLASYALVRRALVTYYRGDAADTVALAEGAGSGRLPPRIRGLAAQREAQGHALAGDHTACLSALDRARVLLAEDSSAASGSPVLGTTHLGDPASMITGWCLVDLGRPRAAAEILDRECARLPAQAWRTQVRYGVRRALAHAVAGEIDHACELTGQLLPSAAHVASATVATDLRRLARTLARHSRSRSYLAIAPQLTAVLTLAH